MQIIQAANWMSQLIDPQQSKKLIEEQSANIHQKNEVQEFCNYWDELFRRIHDQFKFIYRADEQAIYGQYEEVKWAVNQKIKAQE